MLRSPTGRFALLGRFTLLVHLAFGPGSGAVAQNQKPLGSSAGRLSSRKRSVWSAEPAGEA
jgi:hypothetical protein